MSPYPEAAAALQNLTETLAIGLRGALFFSHNLTMLVYPTGASAMGILKGWTSFSSGWRSPEIPYSPVFA